MFTKHANRFVMITVVVAESSTLNFSGSFRVDAAIVLQIQVMI